MEGIADIGPDETLPEDQMVAGDVENLEANGSERLDQAMDFLAQRCPGLNFGAAAPEQFGESGPRDGARSGKRNNRK